MGYPGQEIETASERLVRLSRWLDEAPRNAARDAEARTWGRLGKVCEEAGEVMTAFIGVTEQNPRKGRTHEEGDVLYELLDTATTALAAYEHMTGHAGGSMGDLLDHIRDVTKRAGVE